MGGQGQRVITGFYEFLAVAQALVDHVLGLCVCDNRDNRDGWLVAWGFCG